MIRRPAHPVQAVFVDTNVLLYAIDDADPAKQARAREWLTACWTQRAGRVSTQVLSEFYAKARKRFAAAMSIEEARAAVGRYQQWRPWQVDFATVQTAWELESRFQIDYWDALMAAAAQHIGCSYLLTEDLQHGLQMDNLQVVNPFIASPVLIDRPAAA